MNKIAQKFAEYFKNFDIKLPEEDVREKKKWGVE